METSSIVTFFKQIEQAIQKVVSNKRGVQRLKLKTSAPVQHQSREPREEDDDHTPVREAPALAKLLGITTYSGHDKFRDECHGQIQEHSKTLTGANAGGKFRAAEAELWAKEDQPAWNAAAAVQTNVDWNERQKLVPTGFVQMVDNLHASGKFRPFIATMVMGWLDESGQVIFETEAVPDEIDVPEMFRKRNPQLVKETINAMYTWAEEPLKEYLATRECGAKRASPVFPTSTEALDDLSHKAIMEKVTNYLEESFEAAFGSGEIPWAEIASDPDHYYDATRFQFGFALTGLTELTRPQWFELASKLAEDAGPGTARFFHQARAADCPSTPPPAPSHTPTPPPTPLPPPPHTPLPPPTAHAFAPAPAAYALAPTPAAAANASPAIISSYSDYASASSIASAS
ncbi:hypothetical protein C8R44DRAFT_878793 [Mycena epipterygia]|nr:hypothetical protein C8R44DRAFT_878793 [Mycena epipterygia]